MRKQSGISLIELMIIVAILGILLAVAIPAYFAYTEKRDALAASQGKLAAAQNKLVVDVDYTKSISLANDLKVVCLDGWEYYFGSTGHKAVLAPKWDAAGMPSACKVEKEPNKE